MPRGPTVSINFCCGLVFGAERDSDGDSPSPYDVASITDALRFLLTYASLPTGVEETRKQFLNEIGKIPGL